VELYWKTKSDVAQKEHDAFVNVLNSEGVEVLYPQEPQPEKVDSIFTYDPAIVAEQARAHG
jgi:N-dimethylarginine dimethylaminohydrolase